MMERTTAMNSKNNATINVINYGVISILLQPLKYLMQEEYLSSLMNIM